MSEEIGDAGKDGPRCGGQQDVTRDIEKTTPHRKSKKAKDRDPPIITTLPKELRRHNISDEQLEMLRQNSTDGFSEMFWGFLGAGIAALPPSLETLWIAYYEKRDHLISVLHETEIFICVIGFSCAVLIHILSRGKGSRVESLVADIRAQDIN